jgi:predicted AlkP superfamily phosphohydrolase/phosphomutase
MDRRDFLKMMAVTTMGAQAVGSLFQQGEATPQKKKITNLAGVNVGRTFKKVIMLGMDGLDPIVLDQLMGKGQLPTFTKLKEQGFYSRLATSNPPQSPVAWSAIATGCSPGSFDLFDFICRNPKNYLPDLAILKSNPNNLLGQREKMFLPVRQGKAFWELIAENGVPATIIKWPITFPPPKGNYRLLAGLGVPDINGLLGRFTFYTTGKITENEEGKEKVFQLNGGNDVFQTYVPGPMVQKLGSRKTAQCPLVVKRLGREKIDIEIGGYHYPLAIKQWSSWIPFKFDVGFMKQVEGVGKFYLVGVEPDLKLYLTPIQIDSEDPCYPISNPDNYSIELSKTLGRFYTLGMPEDTKALTENRIGEDAFLEMCNEIITHQEKTLEYELNRFKDGLLANVFFTTDRIQHIFWVTRDPKHPLYNDGYSRKFGSIIPDYYRRMDKVLGRIIETLDDNTALIVCSDHGFASFRRSFHLNSWLVEKGYMSLKKPIDPKDNEGGALFQNVDWNKTFAYALGFGSLYLNLKAREGKGIVNSSDAENLLSKISSDLMSVKDPESNSPVVSRIDAGKIIYKGPFVQNGPDLVVGYRPNYRASWQTAIGGTPLRLFDNNLQKWTGDHCIDPAYVPGVFLSNQKFQDLNPSVFDIAPIVTGFFGLRPKSKSG